MALVNGADDQWHPSLAPIRTTVSPACPHASHKETYHPIGEPPYTHGSQDDAAPTSFASSSSPPSPKRGCPDSSRPISDSACRSSSKLSCAHILPNCFSCFHPRQPSASPCCVQRQRCISTCMHRKKLHDLWSLAFLFPAAGRMQSFYSSTPTAKAQLSGTFPRAPFGKIEHYMSPRTPSATSQLTGKFSHFSSPRTPASSKVQHFSDAIPSPRTPYGPSVVTSPACGRRKKPAFTLVMPPGMMDKKKAFEQINDEPNSPHVTCIGRVRRQTQCKKLLHSDAIDPGSRQRKAQQKGTTIMSSKHKFSPDFRLINRNDLHHESNVQNQTTERSSSAEQPNIMLEACAQRFGKKKLLHLHKIQAYGHETNYEYNNVLFEASRNQGKENTTSSEDGGCVVCHDCNDKESAPCKKDHKPLMNLHNKLYSMPTECIQGADGGCPPECSGAGAALTKSREPQDACLHDDENDGVGDGGREQASAETYPQAQHCLLLMRNTGTSHRPSNHTV